MENTYIDEQIKKGGALINDDKLDEALSFFEMIDHIGGNIAKPIGQAFSGHIFIKPFGFLKKLDLRDRTQAAILAWRIGFAQLSPDTLAHILESEVR